MGLSRLQSEFIRNQDTLIREGSGIADRIPGSLAVTRFPAIPMRFALPLFVLCTLLVGFALARPSSSDLDDVMVPLELYMQGHATGNGDYMQQAFHPDAKLFWTEDNELAQRPSPEFADLFNGGPAQDEANRQRRVVSVDISGDVAVAKIELDYPRVFITDYMTLIRVGDEWKIINKAFTRGPARSR